MQLISRQQAIAAGLTKYFTGKPCKQEHISERRVSGRCCIVCADMASKNWASSNKERSKQIHTEWHQKNREHTAERMRTYRATNPQKVQESIKKWRKNNAIKYGAYMNIAAVNRRMAKIKRTPSWLNDGHFLEISSIYTYCYALRKVGLSYEVDHIIPLRGKNVSGFHVPWNLQVIPTAENRSKGNK